MAVTPSLAMKPAGNCGFCSKNPILPKAFLGSRANFQGSKTERTPCCKECLVEQLEYLRENVTILGMFPYRMKGPKQAYINFKGQTFFPALHDIVPGTPAKAEKSGDSKAKSFAIFRGTTSRILVAK